MVCPVHIVSCKPPFPLTESQYLYLYHFVMLCARVRRPILRHPLCFITALGFVFALEKYSTVYKTPTQGHLFRKAAIFEIPASPQSTFGIGIVKDQGFSRQSSQQFAPWRLPPVIVEPALLHHVALVVLHYIALHAFPLILGPNPTGRDVPFSIFMQVHFPVWR